MESFGNITKNMKILNLPINANLYKNLKSINQALVQVEEKREKYLLVTTGVQKELDLFLPQIASEKTYFNLLS